MPNKKINGLDVKVAVANDLMLVGDPSTGTAYKSTLSTLPLVPYTGATGAVNLGAFGITAASFIKSGGTSSQFLKADGSVDSSVYITGITSGNVTTALGFFPVTNARLISTTSPIVGGGDLTANRTISIPAATGSVSGHLTSTDWNTFNNKQAALGFTAVPTTRTLTINGTTFDLSADRSWTIATANIYNADGTLTSARTLTQGGFNLTFVGTTHTNRITAAGRLLLATTTESTFLLDVNGTARVSGDMRINGITSGRGNFNDSRNTAFGLNALNNTGTNGVLNTAIGSNAAPSLGIGNASHSQNTYIGAESGFNATSGDLNTAIGYRALLNNISSSQNTAVGVNALQNNTASQNTAVGVSAGASNTSGTLLTAIGYRAGATLTTAAHNTFVGHTCGEFAIGTSTTAIGSGAISINSSSGNDNTAVGMQSLYSLTSGASNTALGMQSFRALTTGSNNVSLGTRAGAYFGRNISNSNISGSNSIFIGHETYANANGETNQIVIGYQETGLGSNTTIIGNNSTTLTALRGSTIVNATSINASSILQADSTTKGFLPPRMTTTQINAIVTPAEGLMAYNTTISHMCVYQGGGWVKINHSPM